MNNRKKMLSGLLVLGLLTTVGISASLSHKRFNAANATNNQYIGANSALDRDFSAEVEADPAELNVSITQSTTTKNSQAMTFNFRSRTAIGFQPATQNYIVQVNDANFSGDVNNPAPEGYERFEQVIDTNTGELVFDEEGNPVTLPAFDGMISFIVGSANSSTTNPNKTIYLPSRFIKEGKLSITIDRICTNAISADGDEYHNKNTWFTSKGVRRINAIYIPKEITIAESMAITGVPEDVNIYYEGDTLPADFAHDWTDAPASQIICDPNCLAGELDTNRYAKTGPVEVTDLEEAVDFLLGYKANEDYPDEAYNQPLIAEYDVVTKNADGSETREKVQRELEIESTRNPYDGIGNIGKVSFARTVNITLEENQQVDDETMVLHNIYKLRLDDTGAPAYPYAPDLDHPLYFKPLIDYAAKIDLSDIVTYTEDQTSTFAGYSLFSLRMTKNLSHTSEKYPEPHSIYLDLKTAIYEQNKIGIDKGTTAIRYSLYNLYKASYYFQYKGSNGELKEVIVPVKLPSGITYQTLDHNSNEKVSMMMKNTDVAPDFSADKVVKFEIRNLTIQMDLFSTSSSGSTTILGKSALSFTFAYVEVFNNEEKGVFDYNIFIIIFMAAYMVIYAAASFVVYKIQKEKYKNDEFRRVNNKRFVKSAVVGGIGSSLFALAVLFIVIRFSGFRNTIITYNPADPFVIIFAVAGLIAFGYFVVYLVKTIKVARERRKTIRLRLNEEVVDDGTK